MGAIEDLPTVAELLDDIVTGASAALARVCGEGQGRAPGRPEDAAAEHAADPPGGVED